jgi:type VI secretion system (T6SS) phospholipase Tle1-like effector
MSKRLVVCCDGTWNTADQAIAGEPCPTNVAKLALSIAPEDSDRARQCVYYHRGVGTGRWERLRGGAFGLWFPGVHCDVGGGYPDTSLSDIPLLWMAERAQDYGLEFVPGSFSSEGPPEMTPGESIDFKVVPQPMAKPHRSWTKMNRFFKPVDRPIGAAAGEDGHLDGLEYLATTAKNRYDADLYRPPEVGKYLENPENVHLEPTPERAWPSSPPSAADASLAISKKAGMPG